MRTSSDGRSARLPYLPGLDGLRAFAVIGVLLYHALQDWFPGGFLGVEIFFVISGYLITSLLLAEWRQAAGLDLKRFWLRRARRLLPALYLLLSAALAFAVVFLPGEVARLRGDALAAIFYVANWYQVLHQQSYFETVGRPSLFQHLWSLGVEEQFYLLWPPLFIVGMSRLRKLPMTLAVLAGAVASTLLMAWLYQPDLDPSRLYFGTDTRAAELLVGCALAFVWSPGQTQGRLDRLPLDLIGVLAVGTLAWAYAGINEFEPFLYQGGFLLIALITAVVIAVAAHPQARLGRALGWGPLRWVGLRSYGIYLWHWPVFMVTRPQLDVPFDGVPLLVLRVGLTLLMAALSYRFVETPIRSGALGRAWRSWREGGGAQRSRLALRWTVAVVGLLLGLGTLGVWVARAEPPPPPAYLAVTSVDTSNSTGTPAPTPSPQVAVLPPLNGSAAISTPALSPSPPSPTEALTTTAPLTATLPAAPTCERGYIAPATSAATSQAPAAAITAAETTPAPTNPPSATPAPANTATSTPAPTATRVPAPTRSASGPTSTPGAGGPVFALGDSVMVGAVSQLQSAIPGIQVNAAESRQVSAGISILQARGAAGQLGSAVIIHLGTNGTFSVKQFNEIMQILAGVRRVVFVNDKVPRPWEGLNDAVLAQGVTHYPNAVLLNWRAASANHPEYFWGDGIHLRPAGARAYAALIAAAVSAP